MLASGVFMTPSETFLVYEIVESGFYRIDFIRDNGTFQIDVNKVAYSQVRRKNVYTIGDSTIYDKYLNITETINSAQMTVDKDTKWEDGNYCVTTTSQNDKFGYVKECIQRNGSIVSTTMIGNGYTITKEVVDPIYGVKLEPMNFSSYVPVAMSKDTVGDNDGGLFYSLDVLKRRYDLRHIESKDYVVATDIMTAAKRLEEFKNNPYPFRGFDTETTGTDVDMYGEDHLVGVILGADPETATYFPFRHKDDINLPLSFLKNIVDVLLPMQDKLVAHNKKFDRKVMLKEGYSLHVKWDTMQMSIVDNPTIGKGIHGEKYLMQELDGKHYLELTEIFVNPKDIDFSVLPVDIIKYYACPDGTNVLLLLEHFFKKIPKWQYKLMELECDLAEVKADQEYYGIRVDTKKYEKQYRNCNYILETLIKAFRTLTQEDGNINSGPVLTNLIYNKMHCKVLLRTNTGLPSTSGAAIKKLANVRAKEPKEITEPLVDLNGNVIIKPEQLAQSAYPALVILAKYREYNKLKTAFYSRFERTMKTGRIFFWVNQNGAATGRQSSPMHQLPPELKEVIISDTDNHDFWGPDYSQIELRMIAYLAGEKELIELASDPSNDIHRVIGSLISNKPMWAITPEERSLGKRRNFGVVYLISKFGLAAQMKGPGYTAEDVEFASKQLNDFYHRFKRIDRYIKRNAALVQKKGQMMTAWYHRIRLFNQIFDPNIEPSTKASILRMANNVPVQGTAADYLKLAEVTMYNSIQERGWDKIVDGFPMVRIMLSIHDELIISAHNSIPYEEIIELITSCMEIPVEDAPPFFAQPARMDNWEGHSDDSCAMPILYRDKVIKDYKETGKSVFHQSWFELKIPEGILHDLEDLSKTPAELVLAHYKDVSLDYVKGNYVTECTEEHVKDALLRYIESGFTQYRIDDYIDNLNAFRKQQLIDYMSSLIQEHGMDYTVVGQYVRHPSLTFDLLDTYKKQIPKDMEHVDRITEATRLYIEDVKAGRTEMSTEFKANLTEQHLSSDKDKFNEQLEPLVSFDPEGNVVFEDASDELEELTNWYDIEGADDIIDICENEPVYVWELADSIVFDTGTLSKEDIDKVLAYIYASKESDGFFRTFIIFNDNLIDTKMRVEKFDIEAANDFVKKLVDGDLFGG